ncbi:MAG: hypothetical protein KF887_18210 [Paracoccaceae bacterium]|nr:MAG: hypothetical protein KF887_18210 [Paracoccaceae bacterium]
MPRIAATAALAIAMLAACDRTADISLSYAMTGAGIYNDGRHAFGQVFVWTPGQSIQPSDRIEFPASNLDIDARPGTVSKASNARGYVRRASFAATAEQKASIEATASSRSVIEYSDPTRQRVRRVISGVSDYVNGNPGIAETDWRLSEAARLHAAGSPDAPYIVVVSSIIETSSTVLSFDGKGDVSGNLAVPGIEGTVKVTFETSALEDCKGRQLCLFDVSILRPRLNSRNNYDFETAAQLRDSFVRDMRRFQP